MQQAVIRPPAPVAAGRAGLDSPSVGWLPTCDTCGRRLSRRSGRCHWCPTPGRERVDETPAVFLPVQHHVEIACLTCSRSASLADARASAGRCRVCGGTLVLNELP